MDTTEDGHHMVANECSVSELPMLNGEESVSTTDDDDSNRTAVVILVSVLVLLIIIFVLWTFLYY